MRNKLKYTEGNYIECFGVRKIDYLIEGGIHFEDGSGCTFTTAEPIPLTDKILIDSGFTKVPWIGYNKHDSCEYVIKDVICISYQGSTKEFYFECFGHPYDDNVRENCFSTLLKGVHHLQNIYSDHIDEELNIIIK